MATTEFKSALPDWLVQGVKARIEQEAEVLIKEAKERLEAKVPEIVAGLCVDVMGLAEMQTLTDRIVFTIRKQ